MSHAALWRKLAFLEEVSGTKLFDRSVQGVRPTVTGAVAVERARRILAEMDDADDVLAQTRRVSDGKIP